MLLEQFALPYREKRSYCLIWTLDGEAIGHCNVNPIVFGVEAFMHLHIWDASWRKSGLGIEFLRMTIPHFFARLELENLYSEPYALNPAPHRALERAGFSFVKEYETVPGSINFSQRVQRWCFPRTKLPVRV